MKKAVIVHLWEGRPAYCWYQSVKFELEHLGLIVYVPQMPEPDRPDMKKWILTLKKIIGKANSNTFLIGHSIGAVTILKYLMDLPESKQIGGVVLVGGFTDDMGYAVFSNFFTEPLRFEKIRNKARNFTIIVSDDDPYINMKYGDELSRKLNGELIIKRRMKHMSKGCEHLPDVVYAVRKYISQGERI